MQTASKKVEELVTGNRVDLESCPYLNKHSSAASEFAQIVTISRETPECVAVTYEGIDTIGYPTGTLLQVRVPHDVPDPAVNVRPVGMNGEWAEWNLSQNLTDRWGGLNYHEAQRKPLELLADNDALLERLRSQMWDEITFVVRKDGQFGILFEVEYCSQESEIDLKESDPVEYATYRPHAEIVSSLLSDLSLISEEFPGVLFAVPEEGNIVQDRPATWAFVPDGLLDDERRGALGMKLLDLAFPQEQGNEMTQGAGE